eukprot:CAMPEP_0198613610 /NCGR_PEP_ID=MMETSP1462-20131121/158479_1 /TAXON_ID=1333877 /ORGANISM="Brandtodinium nutriculum, Strain RCC3387" /LENGTH=413 /DNA_ID=CAMNT_0044345411 /DNA_START=10 /DNA_END=1252 /DNA_ORIENTATION=-
MSLHLDMDLLYQVRPDLVPMKFILDLLNLPKLLAMEVSVLECMGSLCQWVAEGEVNCLIALVMYAVFAVLLPILDMALLFAATLLGPSCAGGLQKTLLRASRMIRKLAMLDVSIIINSFMNLGLGFTCFCVFCVGSTVSSLGVRVPKAPEPEASIAEMAPKHILPRRAATVCQVVLASSFVILLSLGLAKPSMSLHLDMSLLYEVRPDLRAMRSLLEPLDLPALLQMKVSVWACLGELFHWVAQGEVNCFIALVLYAGFAVLLPMVDMAVLLAVPLLGPGRGERKAMLLRVSRKIRKLAMLDVSIMGCFVVTMSLRSMRSNGVIVELCGGVGFLLGAELCHYAAAFVARRAIMVGRGAGAAGGKAFEKPQPSECSLESTTTADTLESVESQDVEQGTAREGVPKGADGNAFGV